VLHLTAEVTGSVHHMKLENTTSIWLLALCSNEHSTTHLPTRLPAYLPPQSSHSWAAKSH